MHVPLSQTPVEQRCESSQPVLEQVCATGLQAIKAGQSVAMLQPQTLGAPDVRQVRLLVLALQSLGPLQPQALGNTDVTQTGPLLSAAQSPAALHSHAPETATQVFAPSQQAPLHKAVAEHALPHLLFRQAWPTAQSLDLLQPQTPERQCGPSALPAQSTQILPSTPQTASICEPLQLRLAVQQVPGQSVLTPSQARGWQVPRPLRCTQSCEGGQSVIVLLQPHAPSAKHARPSALLMQSGALVQPQLNFVVQAAPLEAIVHSSQAPATGPHWPISVPTWQRLSLPQQPAEQGEAEEQVAPHCPLTQASSGGQSPELMQPHAPPTHRPPLAEPTQLVQAPLLPQASGASPGWQLLPAQQPDPQATSLQSPTHAPFSQAGVRPEHCRQATPEVPQFCAPPSVTQSLPTQQPLQLAGLQVHTPSTQA